MKRDNTESTCPVVFIVDDDPSVRYLVRESLERCGLRVEEAENGLEALSVFESLQPDIVLLDLMMPGMDGFATCTALRKLEGGSHVPVLVLTSLDDIESINLAYDVGATDFIIKPINWILLSHRVRYILRADSAFRELRRSEAKNRAILDAIPDVMFRINAAGVFLEVKEKEAIDLWLSPSEFIGKDVDKAIPAEVAALTAQKLECALRTGITQCYEFMCRFDDTSHYYEARMAASGPEEVLLIIRDVTEAKRAEEIRQQMEQQFRQSQKMEALGTLAGGIAHDFNNILAAILGFTEIVLMKFKDGQPETDYLKEVYRAALRARDLVRQILVFSRKSERDRQAVSISIIIEEAVKFFRASLPSNIEIEQHISVLRGQDVVLADPTQMHQVLMNLCTNAAHAMSGKGGILKIGLQQAFSSVRAVDCETQSKKHLMALPLECGTMPGFVELTVNDTGHGMSRSIMERIFEPYFTTKKSGEGTGLGLATVHGIVRDHGGEIRVESRLGKGTTFRILLPVVPEKIVLQPHESGHEPDGTGRILIVDDEPCLAKLMENMLEGIGYRVMGKTDSLEALETFRADPYAFDLIISDHSMPAMSGLELAKEMTHLRPDLPVILCTGNSNGILPETIAESGIRQVVEKPATRRDLASAVRRLLARSQVA